MRFSLRPGFSQPEREKIDFDMPQWWEITGIKSPVEFFEKAHLLLPPGSFLFIEGGRHPQEYRAWLLSKAADPKYSVRLSTMFIRPFTVHLPATQEILQELSVWASQLEGFELCGELHGYQEGKILFAWFDAFFDPLLIPPNTPELLVQQFSNVVGATYEFNNGTT